MRIIGRNNKWILLIILSVLGMLGLISGCESYPTSKGYALAIGLNKVDPAHYAGWEGELFGCEPDAKDMLRIAKNEGLEAEELLTSDATREAVLGKLAILAEKVKPGDLLVVSYSGHGGNVPDLNEDEVDDNLDETWCLYDGQLLDDELHGAWMKFEEKVRILVFSDSCHSGTMLRMRRGDLEIPTPSPRVFKLDKKWKNLAVPKNLKRARIMMLPELRKSVESRAAIRERIDPLPPTRDNIEDPTAPSLPAGDGEELFRPRSIPPLASVKIYQQNRPFYEKLGKEAPKETSNVKASVLLISGCEDNQYSGDLMFNGLFTWMLKKVWNDGAFSGDHTKFHQDIKKLVEQRAPEQSPHFFLIGEDEQHKDKFTHQRPYTME